MKFLAASWKTYLCRHSAQGNDFGNPFNKVARILRAGLRARYRSGQEVTNVSRVSRNRASLDSVAYISSTMVLDSQVRFFGDIESRKLAT